MTTPLVRARTRGIDPQGDSARAPPDLRTRAQPSHIRGYLKSHAFANFNAHDLAQLLQTAREKLRSMQRCPRLVTAFRKQAGWRYECHCK